MGASLDEVLNHTPQPALGEWFGRYSSTTLANHLRSSLLSRRGRVILWMMDSATSPSAPRRMTALGQMSEIQMKILGGFNPVLVE